MDAFAEAFLETFDSNTTLSWDLHSVEEVVASFRVADAQVLTTFQMVEGATWRVGFEVQPPNSLPMTLAIRVFSGVFQAVHEFLEVREPKKLVFAKKSEDLGNLYETYLSKQDTTIRALGYGMETPTRSFRLAEYTIVKSLPSDWRE